MRLSSSLIPLLAFIIAAVASYFAAQVIVGLVEERSVEAVALALNEEGEGWANVQGDGLIVILEGEAPTEALRFRAKSIAGGIVDASRVIDNMNVTARAAIAAPEFAMEILRNDSGVSLIGLIPAATDREILAAAIADIGGGAPVADLLDIADYPVPEGWREAVRFALRALDQLPRSKISVAAGRVTILAISDSQDDKRRLEAELRRAVPNGVELVLEVSAPRPVMTPFILRFALDAAGEAQFAACTADTQEARDLITAAARAAGLSGHAACLLALGAPTRQWGQGVATGIEALAALGGGTLTFSDADVTLIALEGTGQGKFDQIIGELDHALPPVFALHATLPEVLEEGDEGPPQFTATRSPEGEVQLRGRVPNDLVNMTVENFARARFGARSVTMGTRVNADLPVGWSVRVLAGLDALARLSSGATVVQPDMISVRGKTGNVDAAATITRLLIEKLGPEARILVEVEYIEALDPIAGLPTPEECVAHIIAVTEARKILFDPGSATLTAASQPVVDDIAEILRSCPDLRMEIAGYTDSQGRDIMNLNLSRERALAVLTALRARRVPVAGYSSEGYGEADPIADNGTEAGRDANRRIEFHLILPEPVVEELTGIEQAEADALAAAQESGEAGESGDEEGAEDVPEGDAEDAADDETPDETTEGPPNVPGFVPGLRPEARP